MHAIGVFSATEKTLWSAVIQNMVLGKEKRNGSVVFGDQKLQFGLPNTT